MSNDGLNVEHSYLSFGSSSNNAPKKLILVGIHGNEVCGIHAVNELVREGYFHEWSEKHDQKVEIILGNPRAFQLNKRFVDINLNRIFSKSFIHGSVADLGKAEYEFNRLHILADAIKQCDHLLDIHSTSAQTPPFALPAANLMSEEFALGFPVDFVVKDLAKTIEGTSIDWANENGKVGVCVECGQHNDPKSVQIAKECIKIFLSDEKYPKSEHVEVITCNQYETVRKGFQFCKNVKAFQKIEPQEVIAWDEEKGDLTSPFPFRTYLIMPAEHPILGEEAWFWGIPSSPSS